MSQVSPCGNFGLALKNENGGIKMVVTQDLYDKDQQ